MTCIEFVLRLVLSHLLYLERERSPSVFVRPIHKHAPLVSLMLCTGSQGVMINNSLPLHGLTDSKTINIFFKDNLKIMRVLVV